MRFTTYLSVLVILCGSLLLGCGMKDEPVNAETDESSRGPITVAQVNLGYYDESDIGLDSSRADQLDEFAVEEGDPDNPPLIEVLEPVYNFGEADPSESIHHVFTIRNIGKGKLVLGQPTTTCGCTVAALDDNVLEPGEEAKIEATLSLQGRDGAVEKPITVSTNDPDNPFVEFKIKGLALSPIMLDPKLITFGTIEDDDTHSRSLTVRSTKDDIKFNITDIQNNMTDFDVQIETVVPEKEYKITLSNPEPLTPKSYYGRFTIKTDNPKYTNLVFTASATVVGDLAIQPSKLTLIAKNSPGATTDVAFRVDPGRVKEFEILSVDPPLPGVETEVTQLNRRTNSQLVGTNSYLVKFKGIPQTMELNGTAAVIHTNIPDRPDIEVPFEVRQLAGSTTVNTVQSETPVIVRPSKITEVMDNSTTVIQRKSYTFYVSSGTTKDFTVESVEVPADGVQTTMDKVRENYWKVTVVNMPITPALNGKKITIKTDGPEATIPISIGRVYTSSEAFRPTSTNEPTITTVRPAPVNPN